MRRQVLEYRIRRPVHREHIYPRLCQARSDYIAHRGTPAGFGLSSSAATPAPGFQDISATAMLLPSIGGSVVQAIHTTRIPTKPSCILVLGLQLPGMLVNQPLAEDQEKAKETALFVLLRGEKSIETSTALICRAASETLLLAFL